jgi:SAM-dependent methyltransferase
MKEMIRSFEDVLTMLDALLEERRIFNWDAFYSNRERPVPFFIDAPDENLVQYLESGLFPPGRALELGCGPGRNAIFLAKQDWKVDAVDLSSEAIQWAKERAAEAGVEIHFIPAVPT